MKHTIIAPKLDAQEQSDGQMRVRGFVTRTGVFDYPDDPICRQLRPAEEVMDAESYRSLIGKPVVVTHGDGMVTPENFSGRTVGTVLDVWPNGEFLEADMVISDRSGFQAVADGQIELSAGYRCRTTPGTHPKYAEPHDGWQSDIRFNHLALVEKGRAGPGARITRLDEGKDIMAQVTIDAAEHAALREKADRLAALEAQQVKSAATQPEAEPKTDSAEVQKLQARLDHAEALAREASSARMDAEAQRDNALKAKADFLASDEFKSALHRHASVLNAAKRLAPDAKLDGLDEMGIRKAVLSAQFPDLKLDGREQPYIEARFDALVESKSDSDVNRAAQAQQATAPHARTDAADDPAAAYRKSLTDAWKGEQKEAR